MSFRKSSSAISVDRSQASPRIGEAMADVADENGSGYLKIKDALFVHACQNSKNDLPGSDREVDLYHIKRR